MNELDIGDVVLGGEIDRDGEIYIKTRNAYIDKTGAIQIIDHLTKVFDIKQEQE